MSGILMMVIAIVVLGGAYLLYGRYPVSYTHLSEIEHLLQSVFDFLYHV